MKEKEFLMTLHRVLYDTEPVDSTQILYYIFLLICILKHLV